MSAAGVALELAVQDVAGTMIARRHGVDRMELCGALALGGITPSVGLLETAVATGVPVHVLIRPRAGGFEYGPDERRVMLADVRSAVAAGAAGVVVGATREGLIDEQFVRHVVAESPETSFHRAFDALADHDRGLDTLAALGVRRLLTSGGGDRAVDRAETIARTVDRAAGRIEVMAGAGITAANVHVLTATGVAAVHASASRHVTDLVEARLGSATDDGYDTTDDGAVQALLAALGR